jgi:hypothetical protein
MIQQKAAISTPALPWRSIRSGSVNLHDQDYLDVSHSDA